MTLRFGTDGVRGLANDELTPELVARRSAAAAARVLGGDRVRHRPRHRAGPGRCSRPRWPPAWRPRASTSSCLGVLPTPAVACACGRSEDVPGAMISASHNPFGDNGIKFFAAGRAQAHRRGRGRASRPSSIASRRCTTPASTRRADRRRVGSIAARRWPRDRYVDSLVAVDRRPPPRRPAGRDRLRQRRRVARSRPTLLRRLGRRRHGAPRRARRHATSTTGCGSTAPGRPAAGGGRQRRRRRAGLRRRRRPGARRRRPGRARRRRPPHRAVRPRPAASGAC